MTSAEFQIEDLGLENFKHADKFGIWLGYRLVRMDRETSSAEVELQIREDHLSPAGRVHGGVVSAFFDYACGAAVFATLAPQGYCSTVELKVNYLRPLELGNRLVAKTRVIFQGKRLCVIHGFVYRNEEKDPVAMATATFHVGTTRATTDCKSAR